MRKKDMVFVKRFCRSEEGATLVEYGIAIVLAVVVGTGALITLAGSIESNISDATSAMQSR